MAKKTTKKKNEKKNSPVQTKTYMPEVLSVVTVALSVFVIASLFIGEGTGPVGAFIRQLFLGLFSYSAYFIPFYMIVLGTNLIIEKRIYKHRAKYIYVAVLLITLSSFIHYFFEGSEYVNLAKSISEFYTEAVIGNGGGVFGGLINLLFTSIIGRTGAILVYIAVFVIFFVLLFKFSLIEFTKAIVEKIKISANERRLAKELAEKERESLEPEEPAQDFPVILGNSDDEEDDSKYDQIIVPPEEDIIIGPDEPIPPEKENAFTDATVDENNQIALNTDTEEDDDEEPFQPEGNGELIVNYVFPPIDLLAPAKKAKKNISETEITNNAKKLVETLASFGVQTKILQVTKGPAITRYELQPMAGVKVSKIVNLADDIALNLAAQSVRIEAPIPGKAAIGIEIANKEIDMVTMREVLESDEFKNHPSKLAVALGKDISGTPVILDLAKMPHLLIAGQTGSGKSVCVNSIIASIMYKANPNEVKLLLVDPKVVELSVYNGIPHLDTPVVTKPKKAAGALSWAVTEMMMRYDMFAEAKVREIKGYNAYAKQHNLPLMPQIVIVIDELADLMMAAPSEVEDSICRLAQLARAAGMHLVIATQRPSVNVITGTIKANIPSRIAFATSNAIDSRTILDRAGSENLLGRGDMLYHPTGAPKPIRVQGAFLSDNERDSIIDFVKDNCTASYDPNILEHIERESVSEKEKSEPSNGDCDELLPKAIDIIMEIGQASTSMLQRKMSVGFARAGRIMDQMEQRGIVGPSQGSKPREILLTKEQYMELKSTGIFSEPMKYDSE